MPPTAILRPYNMILLFYSAVVKLFIKNCHFISLSHIFLCPLLDKMYKIILSLQPFITLILLIFWISYCNSCKFGV